MSKPTHIICLECGKKEKLRWNEETKQTLIKRNLCFNCNFWMERIHRINHRNSVRIKNNHYWIENENASSDTFRGFGGQRFIIKFNNGRLVITTNLWSQGEIPERFRDRLPNNAEFGQS